MFKSKYWSGVYVATAGWWGLFGIIPLLKALEMNPRFAGGFVLAAWPVLFLVLAIIIGYHTDKIAADRRLYLLLHSFLGALGGSGLLFVVLTFVRDPALPFLAVLILPILYALVGWPFYRIAKGVRLKIENLKKIGARISIWRAAGIMGGDFGIAIFNEISRERRWIFLASYLAFSLSFILLAPFLGPAQWSIPLRTSVWVVGLLSFGTLLVVLYAEVLEKSGAKEELRLAHDMQMGLMPKEDPRIAGFDISGICIPASEVGGDFFDYVWLDKKKTKLGIALADVSGKAMKAAMTAVMTSGMLYSEAAKSKSPREILARINRPLYLRSDRRVFTALSFAVLDTKSKKLTYSSAGQSQPILIRDGVLSYLKTEGVRLPLGIKEELKYRDFNMKLRKGDTVVFYTDGVPEAMNTESKFYGFERFEELLRHHQKLGAKELRDKIVENVQSFAGRTEQPDDMTVVVVKVQ